MSETYLHVLEASKDLDYKYPESNWVEIERFTNRHPEYFFYTKSLKGYKYFRVKSAPDPGLQGQGRRIGETSPKES